MRGRSYLAATLLILLCAAPVPAQMDPRAEDAAQTEALNRRIQANNDAIGRGNADRQAAWQREVDGVAAENARRQAAFAAQQAAHEAEMAKWRATTDAMLARAAAVPDRSRAAPPPAAPAPVTAADASTPGEKRSCHWERVTGSLTQRIRVCSTAIDRGDMNDNVRRNWGGVRSSGCGGPNC